MSFSPLVRELMTALRMLPGVGPKNAQRMALHLLERNRSGGQQLAHALAQAMDRVGYCHQCRMLSEDPVCAQCRDASRDDRLLCVVQNPMDLLALEQTGYRGRYFVLKGQISPLDGLGPEEIGIPDLLARVASKPPNEVILATNATVEGEVTAHYIAERLGALGIVITRLAQGVPLGGELEMIDGGTLAHALASRQPVRY